MEQFKTYVLMIGLTLLFIWFGGLIAGQTGMFFGGNDEDRPNPIVMLVLMIIMPLAATIIQRPLAETLNTWLMKELHA